MDLRGEQGDHIPRLPQIYIRACGLSRTGTTAATLHTGTHAAASVMHTFSYSLFSSSMKASTSFDIFAGEVVAWLVAAARVSSSDLDLCSCVRVNASVRCKWLCKWLWPHLDLQVRARKDMRWCVRLIADRAGAGAGSIHTYGLHGLPCLAHTVRMDLGRMQLHVRPCTRCACTRCAILTFGFKFRAFPSQQRSHCRWHA